MGGHFITAHQVMLSVVGPQSVTVSTYNIAFSKFIAYVVRAGFINHVTNREAFLLRVSVIQVEAHNRSVVYFHTAIHATASIKFELPHHLPVYIAFFRGSHYFRFWFSFICVIQRVGLFTCSAVLTIFPMP